MIIKSGRPKFYEILKEAQAKHAAVPNNVGVITCGPLGMITDVENIAIIEGYSFHAETFAL